MFFFVILQCIRVHTNATSYASFDHLEVIKTEALREDHQDDVGCRRAMLNMAALRRNVMQDPNWNFPQGPLQHGMNHQLRLLVLKAPLSPADTVAVHGNAFEPDHTLMPLFGIQQKPAHVGPGLDGCTEFARPFQLLAQVLARVGGELPAGVTVPPAEPATMGFHGFTSTVLLVPTEELLLVRGSPDPGILEGSERTVSGHRCVRRIFCK